MKSYSEFKQAIRQKESSNNYKAVNRENCIGAYQFCPGTFKRIAQMLKPTYNKVITRTEFLNTPSIQDKFFDTLVNLYLQELGNPLAFLGLAKTKFGNSITISGLSGAMHIGGVNGLKALIQNNKDRKDSNGTKVSDYLKKFSGYEIPFFKETSTNTQTATNKETNQTGSQTTTFLILGAAVLVSAVVFSAK